MVAAGFMQLHMARACSRSEFDEFLAWHAPPWVAIHVLVVADGFIDVLPVLADVQGKVERGILLARSAHRPARHPFQPSSLGGQM